MNPFLWITGAPSAEADRQPHDPGPIRPTTWKPTTEAEQFARHIRHNHGVLIAIERTVIPEGWLDPTKS